MKWLISTVCGTVITISPRATMSPATSIPHGSPCPLAALHRAPSPRSSDHSPAWALQDLPWIQLWGWFNHPPPHSISKEWLQVCTIPAWNKSVHFPKLLVWLSLLLLETQRFSRGCLLLGKVSLFVWRKPQNRFNQGCTDCSSPEIVTYLLAAACWKCRFDPPWGKKRNES